MGEEEEDEEEEKEDGEEEEEVERVRGRIAHLDGADSDISTTEYESEDEVDSAPEPVVLVPASVQPAPGQPLALEADLTGGRQLPASIPLVMVTNFCSVYNKISSFRTFLREVAPCATIASETWDYEGRRLTLEDMLVGTDYEALAYRRGKGRRGGSCAIIFNEVKFKVEEVNTLKDEAIESVWAVFTPKQLDRYIVKQSATRRKTTDPDNNDHRIRPRAPHPSRP